MQNYKFNKKHADAIEPVQLLFLLVVLIEIQFQSKLYRAGILTNKLDSEGICCNVWELLDGYDLTVDCSLSELFFKGCFSPIQPYSPPWNTSNHAGKEHRWGNTGVAAQRRYMLTRMISDLQRYLRFDAGKSI